MSQCKACKAWFSNHDAASKESPTRPGFCGGCDGHLTELENLPRGFVAGAISCNESHDHNDWTWS